VVLGISKIKKILKVDNFISYKVKQDYIKPLFIIKRRQLENSFPCLSNNNSDLFE